MSFLGFSLSLRVKWSSLLSPLSLLPLCCPALRCMISCLLFWAGFSCVLESGLWAPLRQLAVAADSPRFCALSPSPNACVGVLCPWPPGVLGEAPLWVLLLGCRGPRVRPWLFRFSSALSISLSLARGSGVCVGGSAFSLLEANSPLYSIKMPHSHLPSLLRSVVEFLSSKCSQIGE